MNIIIKILNLKNALKRSRLACILTILGLNLYALPPNKINEIRQNTVIIETFDQDDNPVGYGTGFIVSSEGHIATCMHVIEDYFSITVKFPHSNARFQVDEIIDSDKSTDLAILSTDIKGKALTLSKAHCEIGEKVFAFGNPRGWEGTVSDGIISAVRISGRKFPFPVLSGTKVLQTTAAISPGSSGGPLVDHNGSVVGIILSTIVNGQNLNFAVPSDYLKRLITRSKFKRKSDNKNDLVVEVGEKVEWVSVLNHSAPVFSRPSTRAKQVTNMKSLSVLVFIESVKSKNEGMILVGEYLGKGKTKKIGWMSERDLF